MTNLLPLNLQLRGDGTCFFMAGARSDMDNTKRTIFNLKIEAIGPVRFIHSGLTPCHCGHTVPLHGTVDFFVASEQCWLISQAYFREDAGIATDGDQPTLGGLWGREWDEFKTEMLGDKFSAETVKAMQEGFAVDQPISCTALYDVMDAKKRVLAAAVLLKVNRGTRWDDARLAYLMARNEYANASAHLRLLGELFERMASNPILGDTLDEEYTDSAAAGAQEVLERIARSAGVSPEELVSVTSRTVDTDGVKDPTLH